MISESDIENALLPLHTIVFIVNFFLYIIFFIFHQILRKRWYQDGAKEVYQEANLHLLLVREAVQQCK